MKITSSITYSMVVYWYVYVFSVLNNFLTMNMRVTLGRLATNGKFLFSSLIP